MTMPSAPARRAALHTLLASAALSSAMGLSAVAAQPFAASGGADYHIGDASDGDAFAYGAHGDDLPAPSSEQSATEVWFAALEFATADDAQAFEEIARKVAALTPPDAREVARAFIREQLGIDGDDYVIAHFRDADNRTRGVPDRTVPLVDAVMEAFPEQAGHSAFAVVADVVGGINGGGHSLSIVQLGEGVAHADGPKSVFTDMLAFLWSRTGPGYLYMTLFAKGNVIETAAEESRAVDEAFGVYRKGGFTAAHESTLRLSKVLEQLKAPGTFSELPFIVRLNAELDTYWQANRAEWATVARYQFVLRARAAHASGVLSDSQFELAMRGGAPHVPFAGPVTLAQLRGSSRDASVQVRRFDINGYTASNLVRFVADDGSEVMYVPGFDPSFVVADSESALREWVLRQAKDPHALEALLAHFSMYDSQDGVFWTGVKHGLEKIGKGEWQDDDSAIDRRNAAIEGDVFDDMRMATERRLRADARTQTRNAWETWRVTTNRSAALLSPLGFVRPLVIPVQIALTATGLGTGIEQAVDGRTLEERKQGFEQAGMTLASAALIGIGIGGKPQAAVDAESVAEATQEARPSFKAPQRINGQIGYLAGPSRAPRFPGIGDRLYRDAYDRLTRWSAEDYVVKTLAKVPYGAREVSGGIHELGQRRFVKLENGRAAEIARDGAGYRIRLRNRMSGPRIVPKRGGAWELAATEDNHLPGSYLSNIAGEYSTYPEALHRAAQALEQLGSSETNLRDTDAREPGPLVKLALGHAVLETLPTRLRDGFAVNWTLSEVELLLPLLTKEYGRPIALFRADGSLRFGLHPDGSELADGTMPTDTIRLRYLDGHFGLMGASGSAASAWYSVFQLVGKAMGEYSGNVRWESKIRAKLADALERRSTTGELDVLHRRWIDPMDIPDSTKQALKTLSSLRHALVDKRAALSSAQRAELLEADQALRDELLPGEAGARPRLNDVLFRVFDPSQPRSPADMHFLMQLFARIAGQQDALLPQGLDHLVVKDASVLAVAETVSQDQWTVGQRHYVRLRHLDGRMQVVETEPSDRGDYLQILAPGDGPGRGTGRFVVDRHGSWFPEEGLREGLVLMPPVTDLQAFVSVDVRPPAAMEEDFAIIERMVNAIPQPMLRLLGTSLPEAGLSPLGAVEFTIRSPSTGLPLTFPTHLDMAGNPVPRPWRAALPPGPSLVPDQQLVMPVPVNLAARAAGADSSAYLAMLQDERPISAFVKAGFGDRHIKVLVQTRRLRGLLREDGHVAVVGATPEHAFTLVMPAEADALGFASAGTAGSRTFANLPANTRIVDPMYGVSTTAGDYPSTIRAIARQWEASGVAMKRVQRDGSESLESPVAFTERLLSSPVQANLWNPAGDPISELRYVNYMRRLYRTYGTPRHAGLDWLESREARRDYMSYFAKPYDAMPTWDAPPAGDGPAQTLYELARTAVQVNAPQGSPPVM